MNLIQLNFFQSWDWYDRHVYKTQSILIGNKQKVTFDGFKWINNKFNFDEEFIKNFIESIDKEHILHVEYLKHLHDLQKDLPILAEQMTIRKCHKLVCNLHNKEQFAVHVNALNPALNDGLALKKHKAIQFNQKA